MKNMSPDEIAIIATTISIEISKDKSLEELNVIKNVFSQICCTISTMIAQQFLIESDKKKL